MPAAASGDDTDVPGDDEDDEEADGRGVRSRPSSDALLQVIRALLPSHLSPAALPHPHTPHTHTTQETMRPSKRAKNNSRTRARIMSYPLLKTKLEAYKSGNDDVRILRLLRLLRYVEESEEGLGGEAAIETLVLELKEGLGGV